MNFRNLVFYSVLLTSIFAGQSNASIVYTLNLYAIDDAIAVRITNANYTDYLIGDYTFGTTPSIDLTSFITPGTNAISLQLTNTIAGFSYSFGLLENGSTIISGMCGIWNATDQACNGDSYQTGVVWTGQIHINGEDGLLTYYDFALTDPATPRITPVPESLKPSVWTAYPPAGTQTTAVPLPKSWGIFAGGILAIATTRLRKTRRRLVQPFSS